MVPGLTGILGGLKLVLGFYSHEQLELECRSPSLTHNLNRTYFIITILVIMGI